jgi:putative ATP-binding cassette transporter
MADREQPDNGRKPRAPTDDSVASQIAGMAAALWTSRQRNKIIGIAIALVVVVGATAYAQIQLNAWNQPFYDSLSHKRVPEFLRQLGVFGELAGILLVLNVAQMWLNQTSKLVLRKGLVEDLVRDWLAPLRAFRISQAGEIGVNPDQRIQEDAKHLTELTTDLGIGLLQSSLLLLCFVGVLWGLSDGMAFSIAGRSFHAPGYLVWCALFYASLASLLSWWVGRPLIELNAERYAREADFRVGLVRVNEEIEGVSLYGGEADERDRIESVFGAVVEVSERIIRAVTGLTWVTAGAGWLGIIAPVLAAAPAYFQSGMSFGQLMVAVGAFNQVQSALRWFVDNFSSIADWRATLLRVATFRKTLLMMDSIGEGHDQIELDEWDRDSIRIEDLRISSSSGCVALSESPVELASGERVRIFGEGKHEDLLFRAIAGLWPWGSGRIARPSHQTVVFMPSPGYAPPGMLRASLSYPHPPDTFSDAKMAEALKAVGLDHLVPALDETERWDRRLGDNDKHALAVARVLLQKPHWVVINGALAALDPEWRRRLGTVVLRELTDVGVLLIGGVETDDTLFARTLQLAADPHGPRFKGLNGIQAEKEATPVPAE